MEKNSKTYTNSELFTVANKIRGEKHCSRSEAYKLAKESLMNKKTFDLKKALNGASVKTRSGKKVKVLCVTGSNKIFVKVFSKICSIYDITLKYNLDGSRWSPNYEDPEDLVMV